jgi:predicted transcriptional regulator
MELPSLELKFLLRLLEYAPDYRTPISKIKPEAKTKAAERNRIAESLCSRGFVEYTEKIQQYRIEPPGKALLNLDTSALPVTPDELVVLKAAATKVAKPSDASKVSASDRQRLLYQLQERGLISVTKSQIGDVWLTPEGIQYLLHDCVPTSPSIRLPSSMVGHYLTFLRQSLGQSTVGTTMPTSSSPAPEMPAMGESNPLSPEDVLATIRQLDQQLGTDNFLPIFHLRQKLQPPLDREQLDQLLYDLQGQDLIEFSTLQDVTNYTEEEAAAGIPQNIGGALFYISLPEQ